MIFVIIILGVLLLALLLRRRPPAEPTPTIFDGYDTGPDTIITDRRAGAESGSLEVPADTALHPGGGDFGGGGSSGDWGDSIGGDGGGGDGGGGDGGGGGD
jgi:uncharacterized membrane protein YgcG